MNQVVNNPLTIPMQRGPSGNPFKALRERKQLTIHTIAVRAGVSRYLIIRTEQGCFATPPPKLLSFFAEAFGINEIEFTQEYNQFQQDTRWENGKFLGEFPQLDDFPEDVHPFTMWRSQINKNDFNPTQVSKMLCVAQPVLYHFEKYPRRQGSVPAQVLTALSDAGYDQATLDRLVKAYARHREYLRTKAA